MTNNADIFVHLINLPTETTEAVSPNEDGSYSIFINARLSDDGRLKAYEHALKHIQNNDFEKPDVQQIEAKAHNITVPENAERIPADKFKKELLRLRREKRRIKQELEKKEREIAFLIEANGYDWYFDFQEERQRK